LEDDKIIIDSTHVCWRFLNGGNPFEYNFPYILRPTILDTTVALFWKDTALEFINAPSHHNSFIFDKPEIKRLHDTLEFYYLWGGIDFSSEVVHYVKKTW
jgi:hypothetical protein